MNIWIAFKSVIYIEIKIPYLDILKFSWKLYCIQTIPPKFTFLSFLFSIDNTPALVSLGSLILIWIESRNLNSRTSNPIKATKLLDPSLILLQLLVPMVQVCLHLLEFNIIVLIYS